MTPLPGRNMMSTPTKPHDVRQPAPSRNNFGENEDGYYCGEQWLGKSKRRGISELQVDDCHEQRRLSDCCKEKAYNVKPRTGRTEVAPVQSHKNWRKYQHGNRIAKEAEFKRVQRFAEPLVTASVKANRAYRVIARRFPADWTASCASACVTFQSMWVRHR